MTISGLNIQSIKSKNRSLILYLLNKNNALSRKEIATRLSLTPAAVTKICQLLIDEGYIEEGEPVEDNGRQGRKEILLKLKLKDKLVLGVNAEQDAITYSLSDMSGELLASERMEFTPSIDDVIESAKSFLSAIDYPKSNLVAVGVCVIGSINEDDFGVWKDSQLAKKFELAFDVPCVVENNVKAYAEGELIYGDLNDNSSVLLLKWGPGIGSSIVANGEVFSGNDSGVAEIGHYIVNRGGKPCRCGRFGCLETEASADAIIKSFDENLTLDKIINSTDNNIINIMDEKIDMVALALANTATILNTKSVVLFGTMFSNQLIADKLKKQCIRYNSNLKGDIISISHINDKSDYIGALAICAKRFFYEREE